jgi:predicted HAD superfamily Cof-like phosphohydrolase
VNPIQRDVYEFHRMMLQPMGTRPHKPEEARLILRSSLISEEFSELMIALYNGQPLANVAQEAIDLVYVTMGLLVECGIDFQPVWDEVHAANMDKIPNPNGGKVLKPTYWRPPNIAQVLRKQGRKWLR